MEMTPENYADIGALLAQARIEMRLTLPQASQGLHIRAHYLDALENGRVNELPGAAYTKGYLQAYAVFLGLDKDEILRRFEYAHTLPERGFYLPEVFSKEKKPARWAVWGGAGAAFLLYVVWWAAFAPPRLPLAAIEPPPEKTAPPVAVLTIPMQDLACVSPAEPLYPACYRRVAGEEGALLPLRRQMHSVMELAQ